MARHARLQFSIDASCRSRIDDVSPNRERRVEPAMSPGDALGPRRAPAPRQPTLKRIDIARPTR